MTSTYVKIAPDVSIRRWVHSGGGIYRKNEYRAYPLPQEEYDFLQDLFLAREVNKEDELVQNLLREGIVVECEKDDKSSEWSGPHLIPNLHFRRVMWAITGRCNYNCKHCFMAKDNNVNAHEWKVEDALSFIQEAEECGICDFVLTGGEPFLHPHIFTIISSIYEHGMHVSAINTNGALLSEKVLNELDKTMGKHEKPLLKISFDGIGHHDWLRGHKGAEKEVLDGIKRALKHGYKIRAQYCVHAKNVDALSETVDYLDKLGVQEIRIIRVAESVRWDQNKEDAGIYYTQYYDKMLKFTKVFIEKPHNIHVSIWCMYDLYPQSKTYVLRMEQDPDIPDEKFYACGDCRMGFLLAANGEIFPCDAVSGTFEAKGMLFGNVLKTPLWKLLYESPVTKYACLKAYEMAKDIKECQSCEYWKRCRMGACTAVMFSAKLVEGKNEAPAACTYFKYGYSEKFKHVLQKWHQLG